MPNPAQEPENPEVSEEVELADAQDRARRAEAIQAMITETLEEPQRRAEDIENMISEALTEDERREKAQRNERTGIIYTEAANAAESVLKEQLGMAMQMADSPEAAILLVQPVQERLQKTLDPDGGFSKLHEDPKIQQLYKIFTDKILHEASLAVKTILEKKLETAEDPAEISKLHKLVETIENSDPGGDKE